MSISKQPLNHSIMQQIINLTDRSVDIGCRTILRSGTVAVMTIRETSSEFDGVPVVNRELGEVEGLPPFDPEGEVLYVVDPLVQRALPDRRDLVTVHERRDSDDASPQARRLVSISGPARTAPTPGSQRSAARGGRRRVD